jgi:hypothetical protein
MITKSQASFATVERIMAETGENLQEVIFMVAALYLDHTHMDRLTTRISIPGRGSFSIIVKRNKARSKKS